MTALTAYTLIAWFFTAADGTPYGIILDMPDAQSCGAAILLIQERFLGRYPELVVKCVYTEDT